MKAFRAGLYLLNAVFWAFPGVPQALEVGFAAISCGQVDPHETSARPDYADEVAGFSALDPLIRTVLTAPRLPPPALR
ncbi:MAG TPA: hypothetical protein ENK28_04065 [Aliiroseovarius sp.]|nr:hypothetical protein [Aliiroseovarius sp.]